MRGRSDRGLPVSLRSFLQYLFVQGQISNSLPEPAILSFELFQTFGLVELQATVFLAPPVISLFGDAQ